MARISAVVGAAVLLLLAGCSATPTGGATASDVSVTAAPVPSTATPTATVDPVAPGIGPEGISDPIALSTAHERALAGKAYRREATMTVSNLSGKIRSQRTIITRVSATHEIKQTVIRVNGRSAPFFGEDSATTLWAVGRNRYQVIDEPNGTRVRQLHPWESMQPSLIGPPGEAVFLVASIFETEASEPAAGRPLVIAGDRLESPSLLSASAGVSDPRGASAQVIVRPDGLVRSYILQFTADRGTHPVRIEVTVRYTDVGDPAIAPPKPPANLTG